MLFAIQVAKMESSVRGVLQIKLDMFWIDIKKLILLFTVCLLIIYTRRVWTEIHRHTREPGPHNLKRRKKALIIKLTAFKLCLPMAVDTAVKSLFYRCG